MNNNITTVAIVFVTVAPFWLLANKIDSDELIKTAIGAASAAAIFAIKALTLKINDK
jgi:hypothetical protein